MSKVNFESASDEMIIFHTPTPYATISNHTLHQVNYKLLYAPSQYHLNVICKIQIMGVTELWFRYRWDSSQHLKWYHLFFSVLSQVGSDIYMTEWLVCTHANLSLLLMRSVWYMRWWNKGLPSRFITTFNKIHFDVTTNLRSSVQFSIEFDQTKPILTKKCSLSCKI